MTILHYSVLVMPLESFFLFQALRILKLRSADTVLAFFKNSSPIAKVEMTLNVSLCLIYALFEDEDQYGSICANLLFVFVHNVYI